MSFTLFSSDRRKAQIKHTCIWCSQNIERGEYYLDERSVYDGRIQRHRWHLECQSAAQSYFKSSGEEEFQPWENERPARAAQTEET